MNNRRRTIMFTGITAILVIVVVSMLWQRGEPRKPVEIPRGDFSYTIEFADYRISQVMEQQHLPSLAVALIDDQEIIWQETFGLANLENNEPAESDTVYRLWSVAKAFTAIETMRLVEDGLVDLDTPVTEYIPDFALQSRFLDSDPITIRSILTHRSGLPRNGCHKIDLNPAVLQNLVTSLNDCYQTYPVGYRYNYSNVGFNLLGYLIERMRGTLFPEHLRTELFLPIGMENTAFLRSYISEEVEVASGYEFYEGEYYSYAQGDITNIASGNLFGTVEDMAKFVQFIFREGEVGGLQLIDPTTLKKMFVDQTSNTRDPHLMGLGWKIAHVLGSEQLVWHDGGASEGTGSLVAFIPERKLGVVLIANGTTFDGSVSVPLAVEFLEMMLEAKFGLVSLESEPLATVEIDHTTLEAYVGKYIAFNEVMNVFLDGDQLKGSIYGFSFRLDPLTESLFQPRNWLADVGLASLLGAPVDLRQVKVEFMVGDEISPVFMIIHLGNISYEICPEYPDIGEIPPLWEKLIGEYDLVARLPSGSLSREVFSQNKIWVEDGVLRMSGYVGPVLPISDTELVILSGNFAGETMVYDPETGDIYHQMNVYLDK
jgi:CubicO group peptidase (beta-lactamase class C family)